MDEEELREELEQSIDVNSLQFWLYEIADICEEKAAHILASYGDNDPEAHKWSLAANAVAKAAESSAVNNVS